MAENKIDLMFLLSLINVFCMSYAILVCGKKKQPKQSTETITMSAKTLPPVPISKSSEKSSEKPNKAPVPVKPAVSVLKPALQPGPKDVQKDKAPADKPAPPAPQKKKEVPKEVAKPSETKLQLPVKAVSPRKLSRFSEMLKNQTGAMGPRGMEIHKSVKIKKEEKKIDRTQQSQSAKKVSKKEKPKRADAQEIFEDDDEEDETMRGIQSLTKDPNVPSSVDE